MNQNQGIVQKLKVYKIKVYLIFDNYFVFLLKHEQKVLYMLEYARGGMWFSSGFLIKWMLGPADDPYLPLLFASLIP